MISLIVATDKNGLIGLDNQLPWNIKEDLAYFKTVTMGRAVVMGRNTMESLGPKFPLKGRYNYVLSTTMDECTKENYAVFNDIDDLKNVIKTKDCIIIGGGSIYKQFMDMVSTVYLTIVGLSVKAMPWQEQTWFWLSSDDWDELSSTKYLSSNGIEVENIIYGRG